MVVAGSVTLPYWTGLAWHEPLSYQTLFVRFLVHRLSSHLSNSVLLGRYGQLRDWGLIPVAVARFTLSDVGTTGR